MSVTVSAPGKVHLMGEHAVVYGKPAILSAVNLRTYVTMETQNRASKRGLLPTIVTQESSDYVMHILEVVRRAYDIPRFPPATVRVSSDIPPGYHIGSSAAVAVATAGAASYFLKKIWNPETINKLAYEAEKYMHGNPSGGDNTAVTFGGFIWFRKELEFFRSIWQLPFSFPSELNHFSLVDTGRPEETTAEMVAYVKLKMKNEKLKMEKLFNINEEQTRRIAVALKEKNEKMFVDALRKGERTLEGVGVVSSKVIPFIRSIEKIGGAAKILGGGGRKNGVGFLLCYHKDPNTVASLAGRYGFAVRPIRLGGEGVRLEKK